MKKRYIFLISLFSFLILFKISNASLFSHYTEAPSGGSLLGIYNILVTLGEWLFRFLFAGGVIGIIVGSINILFAYGDSSKLNSGKNIIIYSLIAVLLGSFAWAFVIWAKNSIPFP